MHQKKAWTLVGNVKKNPHAVFVVMFARIMEAAISRVAMQWRPTSRLSNTSKQQRPKTQNGKMKAQGPKLKSLTKATPKPTRSKLQSTREDNDKTLQMTNNKNALGLLHQCTEVLNLNMFCVCLDWTNHAHANHLLNHQCIAMKKENCQVVMAFGLPSKMRFLGWALRAKPKLRGCPNKNRSMHKNVKTYPPFFTKKFKIPHSAVLKKRS